MVSHNFFVAAPIRIVVRDSTTPYCYQEVARQLAIYASFLQHKARTVTTVTVLTGVDCGNITAIVFTQISQITARSAYHLARRARYSLFCPNEFGVLTTVLIHKIRLTHCSSSF